MPLLSDIFQYKKNNSSVLVCTAVICLFFNLFSHASASSFSRQFIDPLDGQFDTSHWLLKQKGFLPVPMVITEPAVGYGFGLGVLFFHESIAEKVSGTEKDPSESDNSRPKSLPPSISGLFGLKTENGTWAGSVFHFGSWRQDSIRYIGALVRPSVNLTYYGGNDTPIPENGLDYNLDGWFLLQKLMFRIGGSNVFIGGQFSYFSSTSTFEFGQSIPGIDSWELDFDNTGLGFIFNYDSRDNIFTPNSGIDAEISSTFYIGGPGLFSTEQEYLITSAGNRYYKDIFKDIVFGWRIDGDFSSGGTPFYAMPFISLRGIPAMRYQDQHALTTEIETRWNITNRWGIVGFGGVGRTADLVSNFSDGKSRWAGGMGFRYLIARVLNFYAGVDIARGPEDWAVYIQAGSAWN